jgi:DNA polymerase I
MCADQAEFSRAFDECAKSEPALQNIPVRTETGRALRDAFAPRVYIQADYTAIEMRVLAQATAKKGPPHEGE